MVERIEVVAAAILDGSGRVLISRRPQHVHQGGKLEFPGGKRELPESTEQTLARELEEELGIRPTASQPLIRLDYDYPDKSIRLIVYRVHGFVGEPQGREGQEVAWLDILSLNSGDFPAANGPIINALKLPESLLVTPDIPWTGDGASVPLEALSELIEKRQPQIALLRQPRWPEAIYRRIAAVLSERQAINWQWKSSALMGGALPQNVGLHLSARELWDYAERPAELSDQQWFSASVHNLSELARAEEVGVDFVVLGSVLETPTHPSEPGLGWERAQALIEKAHVPVYLIGGLGLEDMARAHRAGAQGIAGIRCFSQAAC